MRRWLLLAAALLLLADFIIALGLRGLLRPALTGALALMIFNIVALPDARAQGTRTDDRAAMEAALQTRLAAMDTGIPASNEVARIP